MARPEKAAAVEEIKERFEEANAALLTEYRGLAVGEIREVRQALQESDTDLKVLKNTLARIAVREVGYEDLVDQLVGPTAIAFVKGDAVAAAKALDEASRRFPVLVVKGGVLEGRVLDADQVKDLARLEPREVQLTKIAMLFNQPAQQAVNVLSALLRDLGSMLAQVAEKKGAGEVPAAAAEASAEETPEETADGDPGSADDAEAKEE
ncbi:MAG TPA: 50S ribosomal protein L10 [Actinomycetota bacterium]|nr:50S ribosomal protein L10 [Actinomycetota bacterium]